MFQKQKPHPIATGTSDWLIALSRDSERLTATPSAVFQRLITLLRQENNVLLRDSAVVGLGSTRYAQSYVHKNFLLASHKLKLSLRLSLPPSQPCWFGVCLFVYGYPSSSSGWRYGMNGNSGSYRQPN